MISLKNLLVGAYGSRHLNFCRILRSAVYLTEAAKSPAPVSLTGTTWEEVKAFFLSREKERWQALCLSE